MKILKKRKFPKNKLFQLIKKIRLIVFDFDGVFTDNRVLVSQDGKESVACCRSDGIGLTALKDIGLALLVISTEVNPIVSKRCSKLKLSFIQGCRDKLEILKNQIKKINISLDQVAFMGNDINDLECLKNVGLPVCVKDSHPDVIKIAKYVTRLSGGYGAVREFCDMVLEAKNEKLY